MGPAEKNARDLADTNFVFDVTDRLDEFGLEGEGAKPATDNKSAVAQKESNQ